MGFWSELIAEVREDRTVELLVAALLLFAATRALVKERERLRGPLVLFAIHLVLVPIAGILRAVDSSLQVEVRLVALSLAVVSLIGMLGTALFSAVLPRMRINAPRILQDVLIAASMIVAVFTLATHAGLNLSGLIATSAVLTAVIGLAFQDTLGNVLGGLTIQVDESLHVGDWIKVGDVSGKVTQIRWRFTAIETRNWETVILPNSVLVKGQVIVLGRREGQPLQWRRWVYFNVDFRYPPSDIIRCVMEALREVAIDNVSTEPKPDCILMDLHESYGRYAVRYWLTNLAVDDPTDSVIRTRVYFALKRAGYPLSIPAHAIFLTEDSAERRHQKTKEDLERRRRALDHVDLFAHLSEEEHAHLAEHSHYAPFATGEVMTRQGAEAHWLYMIIQGRASVRVRGDGGEREIAVLSAGDFFGEMSLLTGERRTATVVALTPIECYRLDKTAFTDLMAARPEMAEQLAALLAQRKSELSAARDEASGLDPDGLRVTQLDLLGKIRRFFALDSNSPRR